MENKDFKKLISKLLKPYKFERVKNVWYRCEDGVFAVLEIDKNTYCAGWRMSFGAEFAHTEYNMSTFENHLDFVDCLYFHHIRQPTPNGRKSVIEFRCEKRLKTTFALICSRMPKSRNT